jgi:Ca2+-binding RTX toxin-like protein
MLHNQLISLTIVVLLLFCIPPCTMAVTIICPSTPVLECDGTNDDDIIFASGNFGYKIDGRGGDDVIHGSDFNDNIKGGSGNDNIYGDGGDDQILGGTGNDKIDGVNGNDHINGEEGNDDIAGADGNDAIRGDYGSDRIYSGQGNDSIFPNHEFERDFTKDSIDCGSGSDTTELRSSDGDNANSNCENILNSDG